MDKARAEYVIKKWIDYAKKNKRVNIVKDFWLLWDFVGEDFPDEYYIKHIDQAAEILKSINRSKGNNSEVCEYIENIISKYIGKYKEGDGQVDMFAGGGDE